MKVLIIDNQKDRFQAMTHVFANIKGVTVYGYHRPPGMKIRTFQKWDVEFKAWDSCPPLEYADLFLIHGGDHIHKDEIKSFGKRIWYGGYKGRDPRITDGEDEIKRSIENASEMIDKNDAEAILDYVKGNTKKPQCLLDTSYNPLIESILSLLRYLMSDKALKQEILDQHLEKIRSYLNPEQDSEFSLTI
ncbi:MAG: hypothetical protein AAGH46_13830, partial [Bacteroidota bacterium]